MFGRWIVIKFPHLRQAHAGKSRDDGALAHLRPQQRTGGHALHACTDTTQQLRVFLFLFLSLLLTEPRHVLLDASPAASGATPESPQFHRGRATATELERGPF